MTAILPAPRSGLLIIAPDDRLLFCSAAFAQMVGWSEHELEDLEPPYPFWAPETLGLLRRAVQGQCWSHDEGHGVVGGDAETAQVSPEPSATGVDVILRHRNGSGLRAEAEPVLVSFAAATPCLAIMIRPPADAEGDPEPPDADEQLYGATFEQAPVGMAHLAPNGRWLRVNHKLCQILGYSREELIGRTLREITHADDLGVGAESMQQMLNGRLQTQSRQVRHIRRDGSAVWVNIAMSPLRMASGVPCPFICVIEDITARKADEEQALSLSRFPEENPNPVMRMAADGRVTYANRAGARLLATLGSAAGQTAPADWQGAAKAALFTGAPHELEVKSGVTIYSLDFMPVAAEGYVNIYAHDVTLRKRRAQQLGLARDIDRAILAAECPEAIAASTVSRLRPLLESEYAALVLFDRSTGMARIAASDTAVDVSSLPLVGLAVSDFTLPDGAASHWAVCTYDSEATDRLPAFCKHLSAVGLRSFVTACLAAEGEVMGQLCAASTRPSGFDPLDRRLIEDVARQVSVALQQVHIRQRLQASSLRLEQLVEERTAEATEAASALERETVERQRVSEGLRETRHRLGLLLSTAPAVLYSYAPSPTGQGRLTFLSENVSHVLGCQLDEFMQDPDAWSQHVHPEDAPRVLGRLDGVLQADPGSAEYRFLHGDGTYHWLRDDCRLLRDNDGHPIEVVGAITDITDHRAAEQRVARQAKLLADINEVLRQSFVTDSHEQLAQLCLSVAQNATSSRLGLIGELASEGVLSVTALSGAVWEACAMDREAAAAQLARLPVSPFWERMITTGRSHIVDNPGNDPGWPGLPPGHPPIETFLGTPLLLAGRSCGVLALANKPGGYSTEDQQGMEALAAAFSEALQRRRAEHRVKLLNQSLEETVAELAEANRQLESFSYSISHDLRAPLRAIDGFSRLVSDRHAADLPAEARKHLGYVRENAHQMGRLIDDLLAFSRLTRQVPHPTYVDSEAIVREVLALLEPEREGRNVEVCVGPLADCQADPVLLRQVWQNLISNAIKFTRQRDRARIEIGSMEQAGEIVYFVKDNGVGFDAAYSSKLFGVFQRLHRPDEFEGTGVGLAIVQRIVSGHGGRVWAEAKVDAGAAFYFTLGRPKTDGAPARPPDATPLAWEAR